MPKEFKQKYAEELLDSANRLSKTLTSKYNLQTCCEDIASECLIYIMQYKGDIIINTENEEEALNSIIKYMYTHIKYKCIDRLTVRREASLDLPREHSNHRYKRPKNLYDIIEDKNVRFSEELEEDLIPENAIIALQMRECYNEGMNNQEAIKYIMEKYNISKKELLRILEEELRKTRRLVKTQDGKVYLGEKVE